jgi:VanZ family protein
VGDSSGSARDAFRLRVALRTWVPAIAWTLLTVAASGDLLSAKHTGGFVTWIFGHILPFVDLRWSDPVHTLLRKAGHFFNYAVLTWLWFRAWRHWDVRERSRLWEFRWALLGFALAAATAVADESLQHFVPSRTGSVLDVLLDCAGALFAQLLIVRVWLARRTRAA